MNARHIVTGFAALTLLFAVGCADGQRQSGNGKGKRLMKTRLGGTNQPRKGDTSVTAGDVSAPDATKQKQIEELVQQIQAGDEVTSPKSGSYQLVSSSTHFKFTSDLVEAFSTTTYDPSQKTPPAPGATIAVGQISSKLTEPSAAIGIPRVLKVTAGERGQFATQSLYEMILTSTVQLNVSKVLITEMVEPTVEPLAAISLTGLLNNGGEPVKTEFGTATLISRQLENGDLRFGIWIEKEVKAPEAATIIRNFYLTYRFVPNSKEMTPAEADQAVRDLPLK